MTVFTVTIKRVFSGAFRYNVDISESDSDFVKYTYADTIWGAKRLAKEWITLVSTTPKPKKSDVVVKTYQVKA